MKVDKFLGMIEGLLDSAAESDRRAAWRMIARRLGGAGRAAVVGQLREAAAAAARDRRATLLDRARRLSDDVAAGAYHVDYEYYEDDDAGYWDEDWELADPDGLADDLAALLDEAVDAVAHNGHATGLAVLDRLWDIQIETDYDDVGVAELIAESQDGPPLGDILTAWAAAAVHELRGDARVARVAEAARHAHTGLDLAQVLGAAAVGEDEAKRFLADWTDWTMAEIERLGVDGRRGRGPSQADRQLADAAALQGRASLAAYASRRGGRHPVLYVRLLEEELAADEPDTAVGTAVTALAEVPGEFAAERTAIADLMVRAVERAGRPELMEAAVLAGFEAALDLPHYLRLRQVAGHEGRRRALAALDAAPDQTGDAPAVLFLAGEFERLWDLVKDDAAAIGWSHSAKGMAFPLLLALLFGDNPLGSLTGHLVRRCWRGDDDAVSDGLLAAVGAMDRRLPSQCAEPLWLWCQEQVEHRAEAIVTAKHRGAYGRAADLVVAFGEAVASGQGRSRGGREFVSTIRKRYPRHRAFHAELDSSLARSSVELG